MTTTTPQAPVPDGAVRGAAGWRKRLRRELRRVGAADVSIYLDGRRGVAHLRFAGHGDRIDVGVSDALEELGSLPDRAGLEAVVKALG